MRPSAGLALVIVLFGSLLGCCDSPEEVYEHFVSDNRVAEDQIADPLIRSGERVVPIVLSKIQDPSEPRRIYAIKFLGNGRYAQATPILRALLENESENETVRTSALFSLNEIDSDLGRTLAQQYVNRDDTLGLAAQSLVRGKTHFKRRSYWEALVGAHE